MLEGHPHTRQESHRHGLAYLDSSGLSEVKVVLRATNTVQEVGPELRSPVEFRMKSEERLRTRLEAVKYEVDASESLSLLRGPERTEKVRTSLRRE
jgi:hypothetical protein